MSISLGQAINELKDYKPYIQHGKTLAQINKIIAIYIASYGIRKLYSTRDRLSETDKKVFEGLLRDNGLFGIKLKEVNMTKETYMEFIELFFNKIDQEERKHTETPVEMAAIFRIIADLIVIIGEFDNISEEWLVKGI
jgi:hypothetical protein